MKHKINFKFISELEGGQHLSGYVPDSKSSMSGVTIATGFDIGQRYPSEVKKMLGDGELYNKLHLYCGKRGGYAKRVLSQAPIEITKAEADKIDQENVKLFFGRICDKYNYCSKINFKELPEQVQTVIASVSYQYGLNVDSRCPRFWRAAVNVNIKSMIDELNHFCDRYPTRRKREAEYLGTINR